MNLAHKPLSCLVLSLATSLIACGKPTPPADLTTPVPMTAPSVQATPPPPATMAGSTRATEVIVAMKFITDQGIGAEAGTLMLSDSAAGLMVNISLKGLSPGEHGFHVHQNADCGPKEKDGKMIAGEAAGEHFDPTQQGKHAGPGGMGHAGDLPRLTVSPDGTATMTLTAAKLKLADVRNRSIIVHAERDDYATMPGGARIACGVVPQ